MARLKGIDGIVGDRLRKAREANGLSREKLAERAGRSASFLAKLELGVGRGRLETWSRLAKALGFSLSELFAEPPPTGGVREPAGSYRRAGSHGTATQEQLTVLTAHARNLDHEQLAALITIARGLAGLRR